MIGDIQGMDRRRLLFTALVAAAAPAVAVASEEKKKSGGGSYVQIPTLLGATNRGSSRHGVMSVDCGLDVPDEALRTRVQQSIPRLRAAFVQTVQTYAAGLGEGAMPNADYLAQTLQRQTDTVLGKPGARLLLGSIVVN